MPVLFQICAVVVTMAIVVVAVVCIRAMTAFEKTAAEFSKTSEMTREVVAEIQDITREVRSTIATIGEVAPRIRALASRFEDIGHRTAGLSGSVLEDVGVPVRGAATVLAGIRTTASLFFRAIGRRPSMHRTRTNGGVGYE